jgi:hypothetical protein
MKRFIIIALLSLLPSMAAPQAEGQAPQQICVTPTPEQEKAVQWVAAQHGKTPAEAVQAIWDDLLSRIGEAHRNARRGEIQKKYEALSPDDKASVDAILK